MPMFAIRCHDAEGSAPLRQQHLDAHLRYIETVIDRIRVAGPLEEGSLLIVEAEADADARALIEADPYFSAGIWAEVEVTTFRPVAGSWVGGISWPRRG